VILDEETVVLGLGGNVGDDHAILARFAAVVSALEMWSTVRASRVWRTAPLGPEQPAYLDAAVSVELPDDVSGLGLLREMQALEHALGRRRASEVRWGPRPIDIDVLLWGERRIDHRGPPALIIPHPRLHQRAFALLPVIDLLGADHVLPGAEPRTLDELAAAVADQVVELTEHRIAGAITVAADLR